MARGRVRDVGMVRADLEVIEEVQHDFQYGITQVGNCLSVVVLNTTPTRRSSPVSFFVFLVSLFLILFSLSALFPSIPWTPFCPKITQSMQNKARVTILMMSVCIVSVLFLRTALGIRNLLPSVHVSKYVFSYFTKLIC